MNITSLFRHVRTDGTVYAVGGLARQEFLLSIGEKTIPVVNDRDFTIVGVCGTSYSIDKTPKGECRIEVENNAPHRSLSAYFGTRDFTLNQCAVSHTGEVFSTRECRRAFSRRVIERVHGETLSPRLGARAIRFANELGWTLSSDLAQYVRDSFSDIQQSPVYQRYLMQGMCMEVPM